MSSEEFADIIVEAIEVFINHILYLRDLYPEQIFKKRRIYNAPVYVSIFPQLNSYIHNVLRTARELQQRCELRSVVLSLYHVELPLNESYTFYVKQLEPAIENIEGLEFERTLLNDDSFLIDFEEQLRSSLYKLAERLKPLEDLPKGTKFKIVLNTTQEAFVRLSHNSHYQDFPWLCDSLKTKVEKRTISILPLTRLDAVGLKVDLEQF